MCRDPEKQCLSSKAVDELRSALKCIRRANTRNAETRKDLSRSRIELRRYDQERKRVDPIEVEPE